MKQLLSLLTVVILTFSAVQGQLPAPVKVNGKLSIRFNKNVELLGFAYFIGFEGTNSETQKVKVDGKEMLEKDWQNYGYDFYQRYRSYENSENMAAALSVAAELWLSDIIPLLLQVDDFPHAALKTAISNEYYIAFSPRKDSAEARKNAIKFLNACNALYKEVNFDEYLAASAKFYQSAIQQVRTTLPAVDFIKATEKFYRKAYAEYLLVPSLTLPKGMGFGPRYHSGGSFRVFNVFGAYDHQFFKEGGRLNMGFGNKDKLRELSVHEFGHSFVNAEVYAIDPSLLAKTEKLFDTVRSAMEEQGYNNWTTCVIEHLVRAGEILIAERMGNKESVQKLMKEYIRIRKFMYLPLFIQELKKYSKAPRQSYTEAVQNCLQQLISSSRLK